MFLARIPPGTDVDKFVHRAPVHYIAREMDYHGIRSNDNQGVSKEKCFTAIHLNSTTKGKQVVTAAKRVRKFTTADLRDLLILIVGKRIE